jgi:hypothetical protein
MAMSEVFRVECARPGLKHAPGLIGDFDDLERARTEAQAFKASSPRHRVTITRGVEVPAPKDAAHCYDGTTYQLGERKVACDPGGEHLAAWREHYGLPVDAQPHHAGHWFVPSGEPVEEVTV